jgi:surface adhesion protein
MTKKFTQKISRLQLLLMAVVLVVANVAGIKSASATTSVTQFTVSETNMQTAATATKIAIEFKTSASGGGTTLTAAFNGWTGTTNGAFTASPGYGNNATCSADFSGLPASTVLPGTPVLSSSSGTLSISGLTALAPSTVYCFEVTSGITNPAAAGPTTVNLTAGNDSGAAGIYIVSNDQYTVSATVVPTFTLSLPSTTDALGTLSSSVDNVSTGVTATVSTNAANGWYLWAKDSNAGLTSVAASKTITTVPTGANFNFAGSYGAEKYGLGVTSGGATTNYNDTGHTGSGLSTSIYYPIATGSAPVTSNAVVIKEDADIAASTPAATDYSDVITVVGAGNF